MDQPRKRSATISYPGEKRDKNFQSMTTIPDCPSVTLATLQKPAKAPAPLRRTQQVLHDIKKLTVRNDTCEKNVLVRHAENIQRHFEEFKVIGLGITENCSKILEKAQSGTCITEEQAKELKQFAREGDSRLQKGFGLFKLNRVAVLRFIKYLGFKDELNLVSISKNFRSLINPKERLRLICTEREILNPRNVKLKYARENQFKLNLQFKDRNNLQKTIAFIKDDRNADLLNALEVLNLHFSIPKDFQELLDLFGYRCSNLLSFSCKKIFSDATLALFRNLKFFSCERIDRGVTLSLILSNLINIYCERISKRANLFLKCDNLASLSFKSIRKEAQLSLYNSSKLASVSGEKICREVAVLLPKEPQNPVKISIKVIEDENTRKIFDAFQTKANSSKAQEDKSKPV